MATGNFFREVKLPEQKSFSHGVLFPLVLAPTTNTNIAAFEEAIRAQKPWLRSLLQTSGVILFRGFPVSSPSDFNTVVEAFGSRKHTTSVAGPLGPKCLAGFTLPMKALWINEFLSIMR
ncbi:hypothetical protein R6Q57_009763 [Mikania cordata]